LISEKVTTFAGILRRPGLINGQKEQALFNRPLSLAFSPCCTYVLVCDSYNSCIRKICLKSGQVTTFAGIPGEHGFRNGPKEQATFLLPIDILKQKIYIYL
jgi:hypothetical protein